MDDNVIDMPGVKIFEGSDQERVEKFWAAVQRLCKQFDCALIPELRIVGSNVMPNIIAVAKPRLPEGQADPNVH